MNDDHLMMACGPLDHRTILKDTSVLSFATEDSINDIPLSKIRVNNIYIYPDIYKKMVPSKHYSCIPSNHGSPFFSSASQHCR